MLKPKLSIVIPTYNRPECIHYMLEELYKYSEKYSFNIYIFDSSEEDLTFNICKLYNGKNLIYERMDSHIHPDEKTIYGLKKADGEYIQLCGDGLLPNIENIFKNIFLDIEDIELYLLYSKKITSFNTYYSNYKDDISSDKNYFFGKYFSQITLYGATICKKSIIDTIDYDFALKNYSGTGFIYPCTLAIYSKGKYKMLNGDYLSSINLKGSPGWILNKKAIEIWTKNFSTTVSTLNNYLSQTTINNIIKNNGKNTGFLTAKGLAWFRSTGNYNLKIYFKFKKYLKKCKSCSTFIAIIIAIIPSFVFKILRKLYKTLIKK